MSKRSFAIGAILFLFMLVSSLTVFAAAYTALRSINPVAAFVTVTVAIIGILLFKKTKN